MAPPVGPAYRINGSTTLFSPQVLMRFTGSAFLRVAPFGLLSALYSVVIHLYRSCELWPSHCPAEKLRAHASSNPSRRTVLQAIGAPNAPGR